MCAPDRHTADAHLQRRRQGGRRAQLAHLLRNHAQHELLQVPVVGEAQGRGGGAAQRSAARRRAVRGMARGSPRCALRRRRAPPLTSMWQSAAAVRQRCPSAARRLQRRRLQRARDRPGPHWLRAAARACAAAGAAHEGGDQVPGVQAASRDRQAPQPGVAEEQASPNASRQGLGAQQAACAQQAPHGGPRPAHPQEGSCGRGEGLQLGRVEVYV